MEEHNKLADISLSLDDEIDWPRTISLVENEVFRDGTHAFRTTNEGIKYWSHLEEKHKTLWYRSTETVMSEYPHLNWLSKKKWPLNEELNLHMLNYQEVLF